MELLTGEDQYDDDRSDTPITLPGPKSAPGAVRDDSLSLHENPRCETPEQLAARARRDTPVVPPQKFESPEKWLEEPYGGIKTWIAELEALLNGASNEISQTIVNGKGQAEAAQAEEKECKARAGWFNAVKNEILAIIKCLKYAQINPERFADLEAQTVRFFEWVEATVRLAKESLLKNMAMPGRERSKNVNPNGKVTSAEIEKDIAEDRTSFVKRIPEEIAAADHLLSETIKLLKEIQSERANPQEVIHETSGALHEAARL